jgi:pilus assembly protein CpaB
MRMKSLILIFIALGCGLVASIGISQVMDRGGSGGSLEMEQILVALADIDINSKLDDKNVKLEDWPKNKVPEGSIRRLDDIKDKFALTRFVKGEPIHVSKITDNPASTANKIPPGYRAMPVKVDEDTVMKAIAPGDRVDVMVFLKRDLNQGITETQAHTILKNVRVFAVNTNTERSTGETGGKGESAMFRTVNLLLKPEHARELAVAARVGKIVLTLRSPDEQDTPNGEEEMVSVSDILKGKSELAGDPVEPGSTSPYNTDGSSQPIGPVNPLPLTHQPDNGPKIVWRMVISDPTGPKQFDWTDVNQLPTKSTVSGLEAEPAPSSDPSLTPAGNPEGSTGSTTETEHN